MPPDTVSPLTPPAPFISGRPTATSQQLCALARNTNGSPFTDYIDIRVVPSPIDVPLFLSALFNDHVKLFNIICKWL